jgi:hypothetical protein
MAPHPQNIGVEATTLQDTFTPEELARLVALRESVAHRSIYYELGLDENRLTFARWLYEHGRLSETIPTRAVPQVGQTC